MAAKLTERFEDILAKKGEACVRCSDIKEERKAERFKQLMEAIEKKIKLEERRTMIEERKAALEEKRVKIAANAEDTKMLTLNVDSLDADARMVVQSVCYQMLQRQKDQLAADDSEDVAEAEVEAVYSGGDGTLIGEQRAGIAGPIGQKLQDMSE